MKQIKIGLIALLIPLVVCQAVITYRAHVKSNHAPRITSDGDEIQISCQYTREELLTGLSAHDEEDGDLAGKILIGGFSDFTERGVSSLEYAVYDQDDNIALYHRRVVFSDYTPPRIKLFAPFVFKATDNAYSFPSLPAYLEGWDKLDGNITKHMLITGSDLNFSKPGRYTVSVYLKNSFGDEVNMELPIHILDPGISGYSIELTEEPLIYVEKGEAIHPESYLAAVRNEYTNEIIPDNEYALTIHSDVDPSTDGSYEIQFSVISLDGTQRGETWMTVIVGNYGG